MVPVLSAATVPEQDERGAGRGVIGRPEGGGHVAEHELAGGDAVGRGVRDQAHSDGTAPTASDRFQS
jgi:hypothetical protein